MKKIKNILTGLVGLIVFACCPDVEPEIVSTEIEVLELLNCEVNEEFKSLSNKSVISSTSYAIAFLPNSPSLSAFEPRERKAFFRSPTCSSLVDPLFVFEDSIVDLTVMASENLSQTYMAGEDINALFEFAGILPTNEFGDGSIKIFTEDRFTRLNSISQSSAIGRGYDGEALGSFFALKLNFFPIETITTTFTIDLIFESGRRLSATTPEVTIIP